MSAPAYHHPKSGARSQRSLQDERLLERTREIHAQTFADHGVLASVGSVGDAYDNAMAESFVDSFKTELIADRVWRTRSQLELAIVEYLGWFDTGPLNQALGDQPPAEFEAHAALRSEMTFHKNKLGSHLTRPPRKPGRLTMTPTGVACCGP